MNLWVALSNGFFKEKRKSKGSALFFEIDNNEDYHALSAVSFGETGKGTLLD